LISTPGSARLHLGLHSAAAPQLKKFPKRFVHVFFDFLAATYARIVVMDNELLQRITINPDICHGKPTIRNKRYPVENMLELMASGMTNSEILADYDDLEKADLDACLLFAAKLANVGSISELAR